MVTWFRTKQRYTERGEFHWELGWIYLTHVGGLKGREIGDILRDNSRNLEEK